MRRLSRIALVLALATGAGVIGWMIWFRPPPDIRAYQACRSAWIAGEEDDALAARCLAVGRDHPRTTGGLSALLLAAGEASSDEARRLLLSRAAEADPAAIAGALD